MDLSVILQIPVKLSPVRELRAMVNSILLRYPSEFREATSMVVSELVQNALKYGEPLPYIDVPILCLSCENNHIYIEVANGVVSSNAVDRLKERIDIISKSEDQEELYLARLCELMENRSQVGQLGLYRISHEGRFKLSMEYSDEILSVTATRGIP